MGMMGIRTPYEGFEGTQFLRHQTNLASRWLRNNPERVPKGGKGHHGKGRKGR